MYNDKDSFLFNWMAYIENIIDFLEVISLES
jgi:hypothetical protein